jgi:hypothetical protein
MKNDEKTKYTDNNSNNNSNNNNQKNKNENNDNNNNKPNDIYDGKDEPTDGKLKTLGQEKQEIQVTKIDDYGLVKPSRSPISSSSSSSSSSESDTDTEKAKGNKDKEKYEKEKENKETSKATNVNEAKTEAKKDDSIGNNEAAEDEDYEYGDTDDDAADEDDDEEEDDDYKNEVIKNKTKQEKEQDNETKNEVPQLDKKEDDDNEEEDGKFAVVLDLHGKAFKKQTEEWKNIKEGIMKLRRDLSITDHPYIQDIMHDVGHQNQADILNYTKDDWIKTFVATKDLSSSRSKKRFSRIFGISLAGSNPAYLFEKNIFDGNQLLDSPLAAAWAAAYTLYGSGWIHQKATIDLSIPIAYTTLQNNCRNNEIVDAIPFEKEDIYNDEPQSMHNLERSMKNWLKLKPKFKTVLEPQEWAQAMSKHFEVNKVRQVCLRLWSTEVEIFEELLDGQQLDKIAVTSFWAGARLTLGDSPPERDKVSALRTMSKTKKSIGKPQAPTEHEVRFTPATNAIKQQGTALFLSKAILQKSKRKFVGFWKAKLPVAKEPYGKEAIKEVLGHWETLIDVISTVDKKMEIRGWNETVDIKPFTRSSDALTSRDHSSRSMWRTFIRGKELTRGYDLDWPTT